MARRRAPGSESPASTLRTGSGRHLGEGRHRWPLLGFGARRELGGSRPARVVRAETCVTFATDTRSDVPSELHPRPGFEELDRSAGGEPRPKLRARVTEELAEHLSRRGDCVHRVGEILAVLNERVRSGGPLSGGPVRARDVGCGLGGTRAVDLARADDGCPRSLRAVVRPSDAGKRVRNGSPRRLGRQ